MPILLCGCRFRARTSRRDLQLDRLGQPEQYRSRGLPASRACPPEDVGGPSGYQQFLDPLREDPDSEEACDYRRWAGNNFYAEPFDRRATNAALLRMAWNRWGGK
jgi:hypothetical protein